MSDGRLTVRKTYKLFIGGAFPRSESGRTRAVTGTDGRPIAHVAWASRKDLRDAVRVARAAQAGWWGRTAYNRGQVLYRIAEVLEGRSAQLREEREAVGADPADARADVEAAVDAAVWWAGMTDKLEQIVGAVNPVAGPFLNVSHTVPLGVCGLACPDDGGVRGVVGLVCPAIAAGNAAVAVAGGPAALVTSTLGEVMATSDVPAGVVNLLTGSHAALLPWMCDHDDVDLVDLSGAPADLRPDLEERSAGNLKRVVATGGHQDVRTAAAFCEITTVWHPARI
jgi:acyl-CoA reductase-like NAD-dependent aldehyde dehydrogenase